MDCHDELEHVNWNAISIQVESRNWCNIQFWTWMGGEGGAFRVRTDIVHHDIHQALWHPWGTESKSDTQLELEQNQQQNVELHASAERQTKLDSSAVKKF